MATYKVRKGDNYSVVAEKYKIPTPQLVKMNKSVPLSAGQVIQVPSIPGGYVGLTPSQAQPLPDYGASGRDVGRGIIMDQPVWGNGQPVINLNPPTLQPITGGRYSPLAAAQQGQQNITAQNINSQNMRNSQNVFMSQFPGQGTMDIRNAYLQKFPGQGTISGGVKNTQGTTEPKPVQPRFPGFWGGGKNGTFYKTLREARQATKRLNQQKEEGDVIYTPPQQVAAAPTVLNGRDETVTWSVG